jgi:hypothetical protein
MTASPRSVSSASSPRPSAGRHATGPVTAGPGGVSGAPARHSSRQTPTEAHGNGPTSPTLRAALWPERTRMHRSSAGSPDVTHQRRQMPPQSRRPSFPHGGTRKPLPTSARRLILQGADDQRLSECPADRNIVNSSDSVPASLTLRQSRTNPEATTGL